MIQKEKGLYYLLVKGTSKKEEQRMRKTMREKDEE